MNIKTSHTRNVYGIKSGKGLDYQVKIYEHFQQHNCKLSILPANEAKGKWKNLRDGYRKYKLKSLTEGFAGSHKYADSLKFLDEFIDLLK